MVSSTGAGVEQRLQVRAIIQVPAGKPAKPVNAAPVTRSVAWARSAVLPPSSWMSHRFVASVSRSKILVWMSVADMPA